MVYGFAWLVGGAPDEQVRPGVDVLLVIKAIVVAVGALALAGGAVAARPTLIVGGCRLFVADFVLLLVLYGVATNRPHTAVADSEPPSIPPAIAMIVLVIWVALPILTMRLATRTPPMEPNWPAAR